MAAVTWADDRIELEPKERAYWVGMFGDSRLVDLTLIMAAVAVSRSPGCVTPYAGRVRAFLARQAYATIERGMRFAPSGRSPRTPRDTSEPFKEYAARMERMGLSKNSYTNGKGAAY